MPVWELSEGGRISIVQGDLTRQDVDAIVNAANGSLLGGSGVDGAIHRAAGPELLAACRALPAVGHIRCPIGEARITPGFELPARFVVHTVGPVYETPAASAPLLERAHASCLRLCSQHRLRSVAFPAISCGAFGYPLDEAARIALVTARRHQDAIEEIRFVLFGEDAYQAWIQASSSVLGREDEAC